MNEENDIYQEEIKTEEENDSFLPDGYAEGDDFFDPATWTGAKTEDSASADNASDETAETPEGPEDEAAPATEPATDDGTPETGTNEASPATEDQTIAPSTKRRVRYQFDHQDVEEDVDDADLPELLQKARSVDRYKERLTGAQTLRDRLDRTAKALKYDSGEAFLDAILENAKTSELETLRGQGVPDAIAEDYISRKYSGTAAQAVSVPDPAAPAAPAPAQGRDYQAEALELLKARPSLVGKQLPNEVYALANEPGQTLLTAYTEYERKAAKAEAEKARDDAERLRKENRILKQNADAADRAPVSGVSKGGRADDKEADDPFLRGFNSVGW